MIGIGYKKSMGKYGNKQIDCDKNDPKVDQFIAEITAKGYKLISIIDSKNI